MVKTRNRYN